ncbi:MAG: LysR family transcriptional regulator [Paracoccaceae bacterium]
MAKTLDRFDLMRLYVRIAETGSLSAAGRSLGLSQPSASRQLRELESELGTQLVMRTTHELTLTEAGRTFLADARRLLGDWETTLERFRLEQGEVRGPIRVAAPSGLGQTVMADLAGSFVARHPGVSLDWLLDDAPRDLIGEGIDLWIRVGPIADDSLIVRGLWQIERVVVAAPSSGIEAARPDDLAEAPAVVLGPYVGTAIDLAGPDGAAATLAPKAAISTDNLFAAERLTLAGRGYSILPLWMMQPHVDAGLARVVCPGWHPPPLGLSLAYPQSRYRPMRVNLLIEHIRRDLPATGAGIIPIG